MIVGLKRGTICPDFWVFVQRVKCYTIYTLLYKDIIKTMTIYVANTYC